MGSPILPGHSTGFPGVSTNIYSGKGGSPILPALSTGSPGVSTNINSGKGVYFAEAGDTDITHIDSPLSRTVLSWT